MAREPQPWRRGGGAWYAQVRGVKVWLAPREATRSEAWRELNRVKATATERRPARKTLTFADVVDYYFGHLAEGVAAGTRTPESRAVYVHFLASAAERLGPEPVARLIPADVLAWIAANPQWGPSTARHAIKIVNGALNWAVTVGHIDANPVIRTPKPAEKRREAIPTAEQARQIAAEVEDPQFRDLLTALRETGCRPKEAWTLTADRVDLEAGVWKVINKTRGKTGEQFRTVYLTPAMVELSRRLVAEYPDGPIFLNTRGRPWTRKSIAKRLWRIRVRLGMGPETHAYANRHRFATDALVQGVPIATVATLLGHTKTDMVMSVYSKLAKESAHMREAVEQARGVKASGPPAAPDAPPGPDPGAPADPPGGADADPAAELPPPALPPKNAAATRGRRRRPPARSG